MAKGKGELTPEQINKLRYQKAESNIILARKAGEAQVTGPKIQAQIESSKAFAKQQEASMGRLNLDRLAFGFQVAPIIVKIVIGILVFFILFGLGGASVLKIFQAFGNNVWIWIGIIAIIILIWRNR